MAELALKFSVAASRAFTNSVLKKPIYEVNKMMQGINVAIQYETNNKKISSEVWRLDQNSNSIICERTGGLKIYVCSTNTRHLDVTTITKIKDSEDSNNVVAMTYLDPEQSKNVVMQLSFDDEENCISFLKVIGYMMSKSRLDDALGRQFEYLCKVFNRLDEDNNGFLSLEELDNLNKTLKIRKKDKLFRILFKEVQHESPKGMTLNEFMIFHNFLFYLPDVLLIFCTYAYANGSINIHQFIRFLKLEQYEKNINPNEVQDILKEFEVNETAMPGLELTINGFMNYIFAPHANGILNPNFCLKPHQNMDLPLNQYFIKSCYVTGTNSMDLIRNYKLALDAGYRHFELDIFSSDASSAIFVGTSKESSQTVEFSELMSIFNHANLKFGPLILTFKLHIKSTQCLNMISSTLISKLDSNRLMLFDDETEVMPPLSMLCNRVLIRSSISKAKAIERLSDVIEDAPFSTLIALDDVDFTNLDSSSSSQMTNIQDNSSPRDNPISEINTRNSNESIANTDDLNQYRWNQTITFQADRFAQFSDKNNSFAMEITSTFLVTVSPKNSYQVCSPTLFWNFGVQSVVHPFPRTDIYAQLNDAFFLLNGNCGYAIKPNDLYEAVLMNQNDQGFNYLDERVNPPSQPNDEYQNSLHSTFNMMQTDQYTINITISVICGRFMPSLNIKPFVYLELYGPVPMYGTTDISEGSRISYKINPRYNNQFEFELPKSAYKQTLIAISLWDNQALSHQNDNQIIGRAVAHIANLRQGFRNVTLYDMNGECLDPTSLLIHVRKTFIRDYPIMTSMASSIAD